MFDKEKNKVVVFLYEDVMLYPPVINLIECLINNHVMVHLVSQQSNQLPKIVTDSTYFSSYKVHAQAGTGILERINRRRAFTNQFINELKENVNEGDIVWTVNPLIVRTLGKQLEPYRNRHIMELMELTDWMPLFQGAKHLSFDIQGAAQKAWKVVVPERNRAYIQKVFWNLKDVPYVLPNKPYYNDPGETTEEIDVILKRMKEEKKKIVIYLGVIDPDRSLEDFIRAIETVKNEYSLYAFGKVTSYYKNNYIEELSNKYMSFNYMGFVNPPNHLHFLKYAHIALLPYNPGTIYGKSFSKLNALYCAPNKIYEYAGSGVPMVGTDVLALREPFEKYEIGVCCKDLTDESIVSAIRTVDENRNMYMRNCEKFYNSINLDDIVKKILTE